MPRYLCFLLLLVSICRGADEPRHTAPHKPLVVLKLDDMFATGDQIPEGWTKLIAFAEARKLKVSIGVIGNSLEGNKPAYFAELKRLQETGLVELWHHGYDHREWTNDDGQKIQEFRRTDYDHQIKHLRRTQELAREKLGRPFTAFGAPYNATDINTARALETFPEIKVWLYGDKVNTAGKFIASRTGSVNIETPVHKPNLAALIKAYEATPGSAYHVLQGHPRSWNEERFAEFVRIIDFLTAQGVVFVLPSDLPGLLNLPAS